MKRGVNSPVHLFRAIAGALTFKKAFILSLAVGVAQMTIAITGHLAGDDTRGQLLWFGYFRTYHWCITYLVVAPIICACSISGLHYLREQSRRMTIVAFIAAIPFCVLFPLREAYTRFGDHSKPVLYCQWNHLHPDCLNAGGPSRLHLVLWWTSYINYTVTVFLFYSFLAALFLTLKLDEQRLRPTSHDDKKAADALGALLRLNDIVICSLLSYIVLLRSAKASIYLVRAAREKLPNSEAIEYLDIFKSARPFGQTINYGMIVYLAIGLLCISLAVYNRSKAFRFLHPELRWDHAMLYADRDLLLIFEGLKALGLAAAFMGACIIGIVLPPPNEEVLLSVAIAGGGFLLFKQFTKAAQE